MEVLYPRCAGLDVHAKTVVGCVRLAAGATVTYEHRRVSTTTRGLLELADWLRGYEITHVAIAGHLMSWAGLCPRLDESAGKRRSTRTRQGAPWLKTTLVQAAWAATRKRDGYFYAQFLRLKSRRGPKKAILAVAASMLTDVYHMLRDGVEFRDLGSQYFVQRDCDKERLTKRLLRRLHELGVDVEVKGKAA